MFYWIIFDLLLFSLILMGKKGLNLFWLILFLFLGFRYKVGPDYLQYEFIYDRIINGSLFFINSIEPFHKFIVNSSHFIGGNNQLVVFVYSLLTCCFFYLGFKRFSNNSILLFSIISCFYFAIMFFSTTNIIRQALATSIILYYSKYLFEKKILLFAGIIILCGFIHLSALFLFPLLIIQSLKIKDNIRLIILGIISLFIFINPVVYIVKIISIINVNYLVYLDYGRFSEDSSVYNKLVTLFSLVSFAMLKNIKDQKLRTFFYNILIVMYFYRVIGFRVAILARMDFYLKPFLIILIAMFFYDLIFRVKKKLVLVPFFLALSILVLQQFIIVRKESSFKQYSMNFSLLGEDKSILQFFGNHKEVKKWEK